MMPGKPMVDGTAYNITAGKTMVDGTAYNITAGKTMVDGTAYDIALAGGEFQLVVTGLPIEGASESRSFHSEVSYEENGVQKAIGEAGSVALKRGSTPITVTIRKTESSETNETIRENGMVVQTGSGGTSYTVPSEELKNANAVRVDFTEEHADATSPGITADITIT